MTNKTPTQAHSDSGTQGTSESVEIHALPRTRWGTAPGWEGVCPQSHCVARGELESRTLEVKVEPTVFSQYCDFLSLFPANPFFFREEREHGLGSHGRRNRGARLQTQVLQMPMPTPFPDGHLGFRFFLTAAGTLFGKRLRAQASKTNEPGPLTH